MNRWFSLAAGALAAASCPSMAPAQVQTPSERICTAARAYLAKESRPIVGSLTLVAPDLGARKWTVVDTAGLTAASNVRRLYVAYFRAPGFEPAGAISVRTTLRAADNESGTNFVELYRPAIDRGLNRCETRGRGEVNASVRLNAYIDYHDPNRGGGNSSLEDFHFSYPTAANSCKRTDDSSGRRNFAFPDVTRTQGDTVLGRYVRFVGPAYAVNNRYAKLRSELHYRASAQLNTLCVGFEIGLNARGEASAAITDHGFGSFWAIPYTLTINR